MIILLALYYLISAVVWGSVVSRVLPLSRAMSYAFGFLTGFYLSAFAIGIPVVVWKYDRLCVVIGMAAVLLIGFVLWLAIKKKNEDLFSSFKIRTELIAFALKDKLVIAFAVLSVLFIFFIFHARTGVYILSPWDALTSFLLMLFFALCFIVVKMILSQRSVGLVLGVIIIFSYMTHAYLPVVYETGFGGDKWRHIAAEKWLQDGEIYTPSIWGEAERSDVHFGAIAMPEALVAGNKTSYASQWSTTIMLSEAIGVDIFWIDLLLVFIFWSLFLPLILYLFGKIIFENERLGLLFAFLPTLFYTFQSEGAITIPVSFGHLFFFFALLVWIYYVKEGKRSTLYFASALSLIFYWGYILNFFMLILIGVLCYAWRKLFMERKHWYKFKLKFGFSDKRLAFRDKTIFGLLVIGSIFLIPFLEIFQGLSYYAAGSLSVMGIVGALADAFGRLSGFIGIIVPPDYIDQGNFLYNQTKESLSRLPLFSYRAVPFVVSMIVWIFIWWAIYRVMRYMREKKTIVLFAILFIITMLSYFISWSFTEGVHILARRLNETIVFFMIIFLGYGIWLFLSEKRIKILQRKKILAICFVLAFAATSAYASGPKLQLVTRDEIRAAEIVWDEHKYDEEPYCVIANTWPLLGLEAVTGMRIIAGNFPVYREYAQPERVTIFEGMSKSPSTHWIDHAFAVTNASVCYYMTEKPWVSDSVLDKTIELLGEPRRVGRVYIWRLSK
ncbi:hypothetical protein KKF64_02305 [Patescibacteria group bacterium]|nr:hypothetical protein [Patescibacteria group bacterium]